MKNPREFALRPRAIALTALFAAAAPSALLAQTVSRAAADDARIETPRPASLRATLESWPERSRDIAKAMIEKYGEPARFNGNGLLWNDNGPWKRTIVYRSAQPHYTWLRDKDYLKQAIVYRVPADKLAALKRFDPRIEANETSGELSSRSESEALNFLALNLAEEIITGKRSVEDARAFYRKTEELSKSGKSSPSLERLLFPNDESRPAAPDKTGPQR
jgi:hypothetical protein